MRCAPLRARDTQPRRDPDLNEPLVLPARVSAPGAADRIPPEFPEWPLSWYRTSWKQLAGAFGDAGWIPEVEGKDGDLDGPAGLLFVVAWLVAKWGALSAGDGRGATLAQANRFWSRLLVAVAKHDRGFVEQELWAGVAMTRLLFKAEEVDRAVRAADAEIRGLTQGVVIGSGAPVEPTTGGRPRRLGDIAPRRIEWLWPARVPRGKVTVLDGDPGLGKSLLTLDLAARVTAGREMPESGNTAEPRGVVLWSAEDDVADTIRPRFDAAQGNADRVALFECSDGQLPSLPDDLPRLEAAARDFDAGLVVIDPLMAALGADVNAHKDADVRRALGPLSRLAERIHTAVLLVRHLNKTLAAGTNPLYRGGGSIGIIAAARAGLLVARDPDDPERRILAATKSNLGPPPPALAFQVEANHDGTARIAWLGPSEHDAGSLLATAEEARTTKISEATAWLHSYLGDGPHPQREIVAAAKAAGISGTTLKRAKRLLGVESERQPNLGPWSWRLRDAGGPLSDAGTVGLLEPVGPVEGCLGGPEVQEAKTGEAGLSSCDGSGHTAGERTNA